MAQALDSIYKNFRVIERFSAKKLDVANFVFNAIITNRSN
jgi:hypothetical protein